MTITYPEPDEARAATRCVLESLAQLLPVTAALARFYGYTHPSQFEQDRERFFRDVAASANDTDARLTRLEAFLAPRVIMSSLALDVAFHLLRTDTLGRPGNLVDFTTLQDVFVNVERAALEEAVAELAHNGYVTTTATFRHPISWFSAETALYLAFDAAATGRNTSADAVVVARLWLEQDSLQIIPQLRDHLDWEPRRLNPALCALRYVFPERAWSALIDPTFVTLRVLITPNERFKLRQIVNSGRVDDYL